MLYKNVLIISLLFFCSQGFCMSIESFFLKNTTVQNDKEDTYFEYVEKCLEKKDFKSILDFCNNALLCLEKRYEKYQLDQNEVYINGEKEKVLIKLSKLYYYRAYAYGALSNYENAILDYTQRVDLTNSNIDAYNNRGDMYYRQFLKEQDDKLLDKAKQDFEKCIKLDDKYARAYNNLGSIFLEKKKYKKALENFNKAIELKFDSFLPYYNRACLYEKDNNLIKLKDAIKDLDKALTYDTNQGYLYYLRGKYQFLDQEFEKADADLSNSFDIFKDDLKIKFLSSLYLLLYKTKYSLKKKEELNKYYEKILNINDMKVIKDLGLFLVENKLFKKAVGPLEKYVKQMTDSPELDIYIALAVSYIECGQNKAVVDICSNAINYYPDAIELYKLRFNAGVLLDDCLFVEQDCRQICKSITKGVNDKVKNESIIYYYLLGHYYLVTQNKYKKAIVQYNKVIKKDKDNIRVYFERGLSYENLGKEQQAKEDYKKVFNCNQDNKRNSNDKSIRLYKRKTCEKLVKIWMKNREYEEMKDWIEMLLVNYKDESAYLLYHLGLAYYELGENLNQKNAKQYYDKSEKYLYEALKKDPKILAGYITLGNLYSISAQLENAECFQKIIWYRKAIEKYNIFFEKNNFKTGKYAIDTSIQNIYKNLCSICNEFGYFLLQNQEYLRAEKIYEKAEQYYQKSADNDNTKETRSSNGLKVIEKLKRDEAERYKDIENIKKEKGWDKKYANLVKIAKNYIKLNDFDNAVKFYKKSLKLINKTKQYNEKISLADQIGCLYYVDRNYKEANKYFNLVIKIKEDRKQEDMMLFFTYLNKIRTLVNRGENKKARQLYQKAFSLRKQTFYIGNKPVHINESFIEFFITALLLFKEKKYEKALVSFEKAENFKRTKNTYLYDIALVHIYKAEILLKLKKKNYLVKAEGECIKSLEIDVTNEKAYNLLSWIYESKKDFEKAKDIYKTIIWWYPEKIESYKNLIRLYEKQEKNKKLIKLYTEAIKNVKEQEDIVELYHGRAKLYEKLGMFEKLEHDIEEIQKLNKDYNIDKVLLNA